MHFHEILEGQRRKLGMSRATLARLAGVAPATVERILTKGVEGAVFSNVQKVAGVLRIEIAPRLLADPQDVRRERAQAKARALARLAQGSSALEGQAVNDDVLRLVVEELVIRLLAGSRRALWSD